MTRQHIAIPRDTRVPRAISITRAYRVALLDLLVAIDGFQQAHNYPPTIRDLMAITGVTSTGALSNRLHRLTCSELIERGGGIRARTLTLTWAGKWNVKHAEAVRAALERGPA